MSPEREQMLVDFFAGAGMVALAVVLAVIFARFVGCFR